MRGMHAHPPWQLRTVKFKRKRHSRPQLNTTTGQLRCQNEAYGLQRLGRWVGKKNHGDLCARSVQVSQWVEEEKRQRKLVALLKGQRDIKQGEALRAQQAEKDTAQQVRKVETGEYCPEVVPSGVDNKLRVPRPTHSPACWSWLDSIIRNGLDVVLWFSFVSRLFYRRSLPKHRGAAVSDTREIEATWPCT